jgi:hypothetical protein
MHIIFPGTFTLMTCGILEKVGYEITTVTYLATYIIWLIIISTFIAYKSTLWLAFLMDRFGKIGIDISKIPDVPEEMFDECGDTLLEMIRDDEFRKRN